MYGETLTEYIKQGFGERYSDRAENYNKMFKESLLETSMLNDLTTSTQDNVRRAFI